MFKVGKGTWLNMSRASVRKRIVSTCRSTALQQMFHGFLALVYTTAVKYFHDVEYDQHS